MPHTLICQQCGKTFTVSISKKRAKTRQYCNKECADIGRRKPLHTCPVCGKQFRPYDRKATVYCSRECYHSTHPKREPINCLYCGKVFLDKKHPHKKYCSRECFEIASARKTQTCETCLEEFPIKYPSQRFCSTECVNSPHHTIVKCQHCGKSFKVTKSQAKKRKFCSKTCSNRFNQPITKRDTFICEWCNEEFESWTCRPNRFCSNQCRSEFAARQPKPNAQKPEIHITLDCAYCGNPYETTIHQVRLRGSRFCSIECRGAMWSIEARGENNPNWTGGSADPDAYGPNWNRQKRRAKKRDNHTCQVCSYKSGGNRYLDVHHIIPVKQFDGDWETANRLKNLICLCRRCHVKVEKGKIPCQSRLPLWSP